jgi:hypothetical protein
VERNNNKYFFALEVEVIEQNKFAKETKSNERKLEWRIDRMGNFIEGTKVKLGN